MKVKELGLSWIVVKDVKSAIKFYTEVVGLKLTEYHEEYGWAELAGHEGGTHLGIAQEKPEENAIAGRNAVVTFTVANLEKAKAEMIKKGAQCEGEIVEVPGHVKMQSMVDSDGNQFQMCEMVHSCCSC